MISEITKMVIMSGAYWLIILLVFGHLIAKGSRRTLFWGGLGLLLYGLIPSLGYTIDGQSFKNTSMLFVGHIMTIFTTTIASALISLSYREYREELKK